jgi:FkbM family methyltransferase
MNISAVPHDSLVGRLLRWPLRFIPPELVVPILQGKLKGRKWVVGSSKHGCWLGSYEYHKRRLFEQLIRPGDTVFDIGAHVGFYTLLASILTGPAGRVFAFEPLPRNLRYLKKHLALNRVANVTVMEAAVAEADGFADFQESDSHMEGRVAPGGSLRVKAVSLDHLLAGGTVSPPDFLKVDAESAEFAVLSGAGETLVQFRPVILLATHGESCQRDCGNLLTSLGYRLTPVPGSNTQLLDEIIAWHPTNAPRICASL